jgi:hypothetical protein
VGLVVVTAVTITIMPHMIHGAAVAFFEAVTEFAAVAFVNRRMLVDLMIVGVGVAAIHVVTTSRFHTFAESLPLRVPIAIGSAIPVAIAILVLTLRLGGAVLRITRILLLGGSLDCHRGGHAESESGN